MRYLAVALILLFGIGNAFARDDTLAAKGEAAFAAKNWSEAETIFKQVLSEDDTNWGLHRKLIDAQFAQGHYDDALQSCKRGIAVANKAVGGMLPPGKDRARLALGGLLTSQGNILLKQNKADEAAKSYERAASISPDPAVAYFNLCATMYNQAHMQEAAAACDKAIAADPNKADAYFIKGSALFGDATVQNGKMVAPEASVQALQKYLALAPTGAHAADVKSMLQAVGQTIDTTHQPKK